VPQCFPKPYSAGVPNAAADVSLRKSNLLVERSQKGQAVQPVLHESWLNNQVQNP
jgi:hypothetical protein